MPDQPRIIDLADVCADLAYPDTEFEVIQIADPAKNTRCTLVLRCTSEDNLKPGESFTVCRSFEVERYFESVATAAECVRSALHYVACHEVDERFTHRGVLRWNPHDTWETGHTTP